MNDWERRLGSRAFTAVKNVPNTQCARDGGEAVGIRLAILTMLRPLSSSPEVNSEKTKAAISTGPRDNFLEALYPGAPPKTSNAAVNSFEYSLENNLMVAGAKWRGGAQVEDFLTVPAPYDSILPKVYYVHEHFTLFGNFPTIGPCSASTAQQYQFRLDPQLAVQLRHVQLWFKLIERRVRKEVEVGWSRVRMNKGKSPNRGTSQAAAQRSRDCRGADLGVDMALLF
ncbi:hypothetical protein C8R45DRAFT_942056 [Mycena sanguinolenta]|nr:hypothetical protein C8R45DRAFT_942056 [Mycena sanguinolenta]